MEAGPGSLLAERLLVRRGNYVCDRVGSGGCGCGQHRGWEVAGAGAVLAAAAMPACRHFHRVALDRILLAHVHLLDQVFHRNGAAALALVTVVALVEAVKQTVAIRHALLLASGGI